MITPMIIATPPKYGTACLWDLCTAFGMSTTSLAMAILRIKGVSAPTSKYEVTKSKKYS